MSDSYCLNSSCSQPQNPSLARFCANCGTPLILAERYRPTSLLGESSFGRTFLAEVLPSEDMPEFVPASISETLSKSLAKSLAKSTPELCVVKQIYRSPSAEDTDFQREARRLKQLGEHPQIPKLLAALETDLGRFFVQAFAPGDNLEKQVEADGPWGEDQVRSLLNSLVPVLQYVHSFGIIHRDIKPANIVLQRGVLQNGVLQNGILQNGGKMPMLVDFGAAKWVRKAPAKTVIGSAGYAAPEQSMGQATFASDVYSLGLTCLHLLTGIHPFLLYSAAEDRWVWQDYLPQPIDPLFAQVLNRMVAHSLQQRYKTMDQVALDLQPSRDLLRQPKEILARAQQSIPRLAGELLKGESLTDNPSKGSLLNRLRASVSNATNSLAKTVGGEQSRPVRLVTVTDPEAWQRRYQLSQPIGLTQAIAISPTYPIFATAGTDGAVRLWHLPSGQLVHTFHRRRWVGEGHSDAVTALEFHPDGRAFYSASSDGTLKEWDSVEYRLLNTLPTTGWMPTALAVTPDGTQLISPNSDGKIVLWDIATLKPIAQLAQHQQRVNAVALSRWGHLLASASDDGTVKLWRYLQNQGPQLAKTINLNAQAGSDQKTKKKAIALALTNFNQSFPLPNQRDPIQIVVATSTGTVQIYDLDEQLNPEQPVELYQSSSPITAFALSADGCLAVGNEDSMLTLWRLETGDCVAKLSHEWGLTAIAFSADSQTLISASADEVVSVWERDRTSE